MEAIVESVHLMIKEVEEKAVLEGVDMSNFAIYMPNELRGLIDLSTLTTYPAIFDDKVDANSIYFCDISGAEECKCEEKSNGHEVTWKE